MVGSAKKKKKRQERQESQESQADTQPTWEMIALTIANNHISKRRQTLFDTLDCDRSRQRVSQMLQLLIGSSRRNEQSMTVPNTKTANKTCTCNRAVNNRYHISKFSLEGRVEIGTPADSHQTVGIRKARKHTDLRRVFELTSHCHRCSSNPWWQRWQRWQRWCQREAFLYGC